jgi:hypothetical protein
VINQSNILKLHDDFIKESEVFLKIFSDWAHEYLWNQNFFPVYFWQDVLYVVGENQIEATKDLATKKDIKIVFLSASESLKKQLWEKVSADLQSKTAKETQTPQKPATAASITPILSSIESSINKADTLGKKLIEVITPEFAKDHLEKLKTYYDRSLLLIQHNGFAKAIATTENIDLQAATSSQITTNEPNPLYVAYKTKKPFHGYLVANSHTKNFLKSFIDEKEPVENLTAIPLTLEDEVIGYQVSLGQKSSFCDEALQHSLATAQELMADIVAMIETKKSA